MESRISERPLLANGLRSNRWNYGTALQYILQGQMYSWNSIFGTGFAATSFKPVIYGSHLLAKCQSLQLRVLQITELLDDRI